MNLIVIDQDTGKRYLTAHQAAEAFGAKTTTYSACEARGYAPQPATYLRNRPLWNEDEVVDGDRTRAQQRLARGLPRRHTSAKPRKRLSS